MICTARPSQRYFGIHVVKEKTIPSSVLDRNIAELLAYAVRSLVPSVQLVEGGSADFGFYYDFIFRQTPDKGLLLQVEEHMHALVRQDLPIKSHTMMRQNARELFVHHKQSVKAALLAQGEEPLLELVQLEDFYDNCPLPHLASTKEMACFKLFTIRTFPLRYIDDEEWHITRIEGAAFPDRKQMKEGVKRFEEIQRRDHRLLAERLELCYWNQEMGADAVIWLPKGVELREHLISRWQAAIQQQGYRVISTPELIKESLLQMAWGRQGRAEGESTLTSLDLNGVPHVLLPNKAPLHALVAKAQVKKESQLPLKTAECAAVYRPFLERQLQGLVRTRMQTQDAAYNFCSMEQLEKELISSLHFIREFTKMFEFKHRWQVSYSSRVRKSGVEREKASLEKLEAALEACGIKYDKNASQRHLKGPQVMMVFQDVLGREWPGPSVELDLYLPERLGLAYERAGPVREKVAPVSFVISVFGSLERFIALLVEQYEGKFPSWMEKGLTSREK